MKINKIQILVLLLFTFGFAFPFGINFLSEKKSAQYDFVITIHGNFFHTTYYSNDPPMYGSNCVMFIDAVTGLLVVEIAPRITARSTVPEPISREPTDNKKPRRYLL